MKISYTYILFSLFLAFLPGCELIHDDLPATRADGEPVYIRLQISTGGEMSATRSNPTGGEDGDEREPGTDAENAVSNVTLFLYDADVDITSADADLTNTTIDKIIYFNNISEIANNESPTIEKKYTTETQEITGLSEPSYNVLAIANIDLREQNFANLQVLLDYKLENTALWSSANTSFVMSSEETAVLPENGSPTIYASTEMDPATTTITIERLAAKVDYKVNQASFTTDDGSTVKILGAQLVNDFKKGEYLFKRVHATNVDATSGWSYLGDELPVNPSGDATNWVVDAYDTKTKQTSDYNNPYFSFVPSVDFPANASTTDFVLLGYTMENTNDVSSDELGKYATGVVFKAQYTPKDFATEGSDFYYLNNTFYSSIQEIKDKNLPGLEGLTETNYENYGIDFYDDGICYYTWWIRHSNNANDDIMRYGIVRNNWYQLTVNSIKGLPSGDDDIVIIVAVEKWQPLNPEDLTLRK